MAELDPLVAEILLKGDDEFLGKLKKVGEDAAEHFEKLSNAIKAGATSAQALTGSLGLIEAAIAAATAATISFIEKQTELSQKTMLLADAFGVTAGQLQDIEATFAGAGVQVEAFERFANRLTITIAREWPQIAESIKNYATENDAAALRVQNAILGVRDAQNQLADNSSERLSQMSKDNLALEASYLKLQFAAQHAASEQLGAAQSVRGAELSSLAAVQALNTARGFPPSAGEKQTLAIAQAQQAVDVARKAEADARIAQQEKAANASLKRAQMEQEYDDLARKAAKNLRDDAEQRQKDENAVKGAIIARAEAEEKAGKLALTNISSIRDALKGIETGNKDAAKAVNLTEVTVQNLTKGIIAQAAAANNGKQPTGYQTMIELSKILKADTEKLITEEQRLAIVNHLAATGMQALGGVGAELLHVLEHDTEQLQRLNEQVKALDTPEAKKKVEAFRGALALLTLDISILSQKFAIAVAPAFTAFLDAIRKSLEDNNGVIHLFVDGLAAIGSAISVAVTWIEKMVDRFAKWIGLKDAGVIWTAIFVAIGAAVAVTATALLAWPLIIAGIVTAIGYIVDNWDKVSAGIKRAWNDLTDNKVTRFLADMLEKLKNIVTLWGLIGKATPTAVPTQQNDAGRLDSGVQALAGGGEVRGAGSGTSDSILSRLSNGEFVIRAAAVQAYGANLFHSLNNMMIPGFAGGGLVSTPIRSGSGGPVQPTSTLNLSIDGRSFNGLSGPKTTIDDLSSFAISRQASAAGSNPSWMK